MFVRLLTILLVSSVLGDSDRRCQFPPKMEGHIQILHNAQPVFFPNARFAVDYEGKKSAIIRHPTNDNVFMRMDLKKGILYHKYEDGSCSEFALDPEVKLYRGVPSYASPAGFDITGLGDSGAEWTFQDHGGTTYMAVLKADCQPVVIHRHLYNGPKERTEQYFNVKKSIEDPAILDKTCDDSHLG